MFEPLPVNDKGILAFRVSGKLTDADYQVFIPLLESLIRERGQISLYMELEDFKGWEPRAAWDDLRFGLKHDRDFRRIAIVGDREWEHAAIALANLFTDTPMRFFRREEAAAAWDWLEEDSEDGTGDEPLSPVAPWKHILLATDFSPASVPATMRAKQLAAVSGARLEVLHVIEETAFYINEVDLMGAELILKRDEAVMAQAQKEIQRLVQRAGLGGDTLLEVQWGKPSRTIVSWAREKQVDLIVVGSHGYHGLGRLLGSVSNSVLHDAPCEVLLVRA